jgi:hypothetical protein
MEGNWKFLEETDQYEVIEVDTEARGWGRLRIHKRSSCEGRHCSFHNPSNHHMKDWPMLVRMSSLVERICPHGVGHPDPDSVAWLEENGPEGAKGTWGIHGDDGCCSKERR